MQLETELVNGFVRARSADVARLLETMSAPDAASVMTVLGVDELALLLRRMAPPPAANALELVSPSIAAPALAATRHDAAAAILRAMETPERLTLLGSLRADAERPIRRLLRFSEGTAGALMDPQVLTVDRELSVGEALERVRRSGQHALDYVYVVDEDQKLVGVASLRELVQARPDPQIGLIASHTMETLPRGATAASIVTHPAWTRFHTLPVVEADGRFLGVVRYESMRSLEHELMETQHVDEGAETAAALGELYGLGLRAVFEWVGAAIFGSERTGRRS